MCYFPFYLLCSIIWSVKISRLSIQCLWDIQPQTQQRFAAKVQYNKEKNLIWFTFPALCVYVSSSSFCVTTWSNNFNKGSVCLYNQWQHIKQCGARLNLLFSDIMCFLLKTSLTGTHRSLQYCYITQCDHILVFIQGAKEASQRDLSRGPFLWQRPLIKLSSLDQTVQYRYVSIFSIFQLSVLVLLTTVLFWVQPHCSHSVHF